jgi:hypothetical protein
MMNKNRLATFMFLAALTALTVRMLTAASFLETPSPFLKYYAATFYPADHPTKPEKLRIMTTADGIRFVDVPTTYIPVNATGAVRNPAILFRNDMFYLAHADSSELTGWTLSSHISFAVSGDGRTYRPLARPDFGGVEPFGPDPTIWAGNWVVDADDSVHYIFAAAPRGGANQHEFRLYEIHPTTSMDFTAWSTPVTLTGSAIIDGLIDPFVVRDGSNYFIWCQNIGGDRSVTVLKSTTALLAGYDTTLHSGNWNGFGTGGNDQPLVYEINGKQIAYTDFGFTHVYYARQLKGDWRDGGSTSWSEIAPTRATPPAMRAGSMILTPTVLFSGLAK